MSVVMELKRVEDKRFTNKKFFGKDFSDMDLSNADFRGCTLCECKFVNSDLTKADMRGSNCWGADFTNSIMFRTDFKDAILAKSIFDPKRIFGVTLTISCDTFEGVKIGRNALLYWLYMPLLMQLPEPEIGERLKVAIGEKTCDALERVFKENILT
jgi:hypothetical protein